MSGVARIGVLAVTTIAAVPLAAQQTRAAFAPITSAVAAEISGERAHRTVAGIERWFRLPGNVGFDAAIDSVVGVLRAAGYREEAGASPSDRLVYRVEERPMRGPAWTPEAARLSIEGSAAPLLDFETNRNMIAINSWPTPAGGVTAEVVDVGDGSEAAFARTEVRGRIVTGTANARVLYLRAMQNGALGVLAPQRLPAYNRPEVNRTAIQFTGIAYDSVFRGFAIHLSVDAAARLAEAMKRGPVRATVEVRTRFDVRPERTLVAELRGNSLPDERFVYSAHVQEPGANDNASGVGTLAEMARAASALLREGKIDPARTMTFLWGDEITSTRRYIVEDSVRQRGIRWGMSLDMVGENTELTGGTFLIEKMPDPSAVWVRGEDQHSEWGGRPLGVDRIWAHWLNDFTRQRCLDRARTTGWVVRANPFEGGSDHTPFLSARIPAVLFWHFTDQFYHTDRDRIENVSPVTLGNVANCALTSGLLLTAASADIAREAIDELAAVAERELATQAGLSAAAVAAGGKVEDERTVLATWRDYFLGALDATPEIGPAAGDYSAAIAAAKGRVTAAAAEALRRLP